VQDALEEKLGAIECEGRNVENKKPRNAQEMISKMDEQRKLTNVNNEEGREEELLTTEE
jgi:hypothetical protein